MRQGRQENAADFSGRPRFYRTPYVGQHGWVSLRATTRLNWEEIAELVRGSYELVTVQKKRGEPVQTRRR